MRHMNGVLIAARWGALILFFSAGVGCPTRFVTGENYYCDQANPCTLPLVCSPFTLTCVDPTKNARCRSSVDCPLVTPSCDATMRLCQACAGPAQDALCMTASMSRLPFCDATSHACVACRGSGDCKNEAAPVCVSGACRGCVGDADCPSAVCLAGSCVPSDKVLFADNKRCNKAMQTGSLAMPFCEIADAVSAVNLGGSTVVIRVAATGMDYVKKLVIKSSIVISGPGVMAMPRVQINPAAGDAAPCIDVQSGVVVIDGVSVLGGGGAGVSCRMGSTLTLENSTIDGNADVGVVANNCAHLTLDANAIVNNRGGGIQVMSTPYSIVNQLIALNGLNGPAVILDDTSAGDFSFNTVAGNLSPAGMAAGIDCGGGAAKTLQYSIVVGNSQVFTMMGNVQTQFIGTACALQTVVTGVDTYPKADPAMPVFKPKSGMEVFNYHLVPGENPCCIDVDKVIKTLALPTHDLDGNVRPYNGKWDLGAYESQGN